ncbi:MAG TPA: GspH/FimT family pseudopilin [Burkholderiaceae bacterium]|jgi:general secretion pathway protein H
MPYQSSSSTRKRILTGGFTLLELLVVIVIAGIMLGMVSFNAIPGDRQVLQNEAQRVALLLQLARDEAIVRNRQVAFEADSEHYRFLVRDDNGWQPITDDDLFREREFKRALALSINPPLSEGTQGFRIIFGREPVDKPFVLTLSAGDASIAIRADGVGHYVVE